jgi:hypothetical protein
VLLLHPRLGEQQHVVQLAVERESAFPKRAPEGRPGREEIVPGAGQRQLQPLERASVPEHHAGGIAHGQGVELAGDAPRGDIVGGQLLAHRRPQQGLQVGEARAAFAEHREPGPVDLHHVGLRAPGDLRGQALEVAVEAHVLGLDLRARVALLEQAHRLDRGFVASAAAPPREAQRLL